MTSAVASSVLQQLCATNIRIGLGAHTLTARKQSARLPAFSTRLANYVAQGFDLLEYHFTLPHLPTDDVLRAAMRTPMLEIVWRTAFDDFDAGLRFMERPEWAVFITQLAEQRLKGVRHTVSLAFDRTLRYAAERLDPILRVCATINEHVPTVLEFEHAGWKRSEALLVRSKVPRIELDAPALPGLVKPLTGEDRKRAYLKLVGRNAKGWLEQDPSERYCHTYTADELTAIARRILELRSRSDEVVVIVGNYPADVAYPTALTLATIVHTQQHASGAFSPTLREAA